ncbi:hypothetical protein T08_5011 [Trichinella sp. T8]|nr:hypothetical protein T08_5011 [Trichinella sp. T8]
MKQQLWTAVDLVSLSIGWTIYCSVNKPRVPVDRGKLNDRTTAEASQNKVEVARSHSSQSVAFGTFCSDNSIFSGPNILQIAMNQQQRLYCIVQKQIATPLDISCLLRSTLALVLVHFHRRGQFFFFSHFVNWWNEVDRLPPAHAPKFTWIHCSKLLNFDQSILLSLCGHYIKRHFKWRNVEIDVFFVDCHLHMYHLFIRGCFKSFSNAEVSQLLKFDGEFALFTTLASRIIDIVEMRGMFKFNYPDIYYIILTATTTLEQFKPRYIALIKSSNIGKYFYALITERRLGYHGNFTFTLETLPMNELLKKLSLSLPKMRMHACETSSRTSKRLSIIYNYYNASMCKIEICIIKGRMFSRCDH